MSITDTPKLSSTLTCNIFNEHYLYSVNRDNFKKISANVIFDKEFKKKIFTEDSLYIIVGTDSGLLPKYIQQQGIPSGTRYLFIEPEEILTELQQLNLLDNLDPTIICTTYDKWEQKAEELQIEQYSYLSAVHSLSAICTQQNDTNNDTELNWKVSESVQTIHWNYSSRVATEMFTIRQIENITEVQNPAILLKNAFQGQTVVILAGGPSLTDILPWVTENRTKLVVFSVSRISRQLLNENITPDFIFSVDPVTANFNVSHEMFSFNNKPILIHANHIYPELLNQWQGRSLYLASRLPWASPLNIDNLESIGPTVTNTALLTAQNFGFNTILLAGVDLCYAKNGTTHAKGSVEEVAGPKYNTTSFQVKTYANELRGTEEGYFIALENLSQQTESFIKDTNKRVINLSKNAAQANGIIHIPPEDIKLSDLNQSISEIIDERLNLETDQRSYYQDILKELTKAKQHIKKIENISKKAIKINASMYNSSGIIENYKDKKNLDKIEKTLNKEHARFSLLVKNFGLRQFLKITSPHNDDRLLTAKQAQKMGHIYYAAYQSGANTLALLIEQAISRTIARQEEEKSHPDFNALFEQWNKDRSYKRATIWKQNHEQVEIPENKKNDLLLFSKKFDDHLLNSASEFKMSMESARSSIVFFKTKANTLFNHQQLVELKELKEKLILDDRNKNKKEYLFLITAYIAELEGEKTLALDYYHKIINSNNPSILEDSLARITSISIEQQDHKNAFLALECLSQISPTYLPFYAESANLLGDSLLAIDSYITYINLFPNDIITQLKLAHLYITNKIYDGADLMLNHILLHSPELEEAHTLKRLIKNL